ncbi:hypothetical protein LCGC14_1778380, partial [marine sediment metagenome]
MRRPQPDEVYADNDGGTLKICYATDKKVVSIFRIKSDGILHR